MKRYRPCHTIVAVARAPISVCLIVRDEADNLPTCLGSVLPICEEVVVVDTGSRDATPRIASELGASVFSFPWIDDFSAARNFAASHARQPFILRLDADERLAPDSLPALEAYCKAVPPIAGRAALKNVNPNAAESTLEYLTCLYPNTPDYRYERRIHEQLRFKGGAPLTRQTDLLILHTGYSPEIMEQRGKAQRNLRLLERELADKPADPYLRYQTGRTHYVLKDYASAAASFEAALALLDGTPPAEIPYLSTIFSQLAYCHVYMRDLESAIGTVGAGLQLFPDYTDLYFVYGVALMQLGGAGHVDEMVAAFERCLAMGEPDPLRHSTVAGVGSFRAQHNLGAFREALGDLDGAASYYSQAAAAGFQPSIDRLRAMRRITD